MDPESIIIVFFFTSLILITYALWGISRILRKLLTSKTYRISKENFCDLVAQEKEPIILFFYDRLEYHYTVKIQGDEFTCVTPQEQDFGDKCRLVRIKYYTDR